MDHPRCLAILLPYSMPLISDLDQDITKMYQFDVRNRLAILEDVPVCQNELSTSRVSKVIVTHTYLGYIPTDASKNEKKT